MGGQVKTAHALEFLMSMPMGKEEEIDYCPILQGGMSSGLFICEEFAEGFGGVVGLFSQPAFEMTDLAQGPSCCHPGKKD